MQQLDVYYQYFLNMFRVSLCSSSGDQDVLRCRVRAVWRLLLNSNLHSARTLQRSAPQPLPSQCSLPTTQRPTTATFTVLAPYNAAPHNRYLHSARTLQRSAPQPLPSQCSLPTTQRPTTATNHIQQNQRSTPYAVTHGLCSLEDGHNDARNMLRKYW